MKEEKNLEYQINEDMINEKLDKLMDRVKTENDALRKILEGLDEIQKKEMENAAKHKKK